MKSKLLTIKGTEKDIKQARQLLNGLLKITQTKFTQIEMLNKALRFYYEVSK